MILATDFKRGHTTVASVRLAFPSLFPKKKRWSRGVSGEQSKSNNMRGSLDDSFLSNFLTNIKNLPQRGRQTLRMRKVPRIHPDPTGNTITSKPNDEHLQLVLNLVIECADVGYSAKPLRNHQQWSVLAKEEFYEQGKLEMSMGIPISTNCDIKHDHTWSKSQRAFLSFYGAPKFRALSRFCNKTKLYVDLMEKNYNFWGGSIMTRSSSDEVSTKSSEAVGLESTSFVTLRKTLNESNPNFRLALKKVRERVMSSESGEKEKSILSNVIQMGSNMLQRGYKAMKKMPKNERNTNWYNNQLNQIGETYAKYIQCIEPFPEFDSTNVMDTWPIKKIQALTVATRKIEDETRKIANKVEACIEEAQENKNVGYLNFKIRVFDKNMYFETRTFEGTPEKMLKDQDEGSPVIDALLGFDTYRAILDDQSWYERHVLNLFETLASYREHVKPCPNFDRLEALQEWCYEELIPVRQMKQALEKETESIVEKINELLVRASKAKVESLSFKARIVRVKGQQNIVQFNGTPNNLMSENGETIKSELMNTDMYSFLIDHSRAKKAVDDGESILFKGEFPERRQSHSDRRSNNSSSGERRETG